MRWCVSAAGRKGQLRMRAGRVADDDAPHNGEPPQVPACGEDGQPVRSAAWHATQAHRRLHMARRHASDRDATQRARRHGSPSADAARWASPEVRLAAFACAAAPYSTACHTRLGFDSARSVRQIGKGPPPHLCGQMQGSSKSKVTLPPSRDAEDPCGNPAMPAVWVRRNKARRVLPGYAPLYHPTDRRCCARPHCACLCCAAE